MTNSEEGGVKENFSVPPKEGFRESKWLSPPAPIQTSSDLITPPFGPLRYEECSFVGQTTEGTIALTNYRIFVEGKVSSANVPLGLVDSVELRDIFFLHVLCKDARAIRVTFPTADGAAESQRRISSALAPPRNLRDSFAFTFARCSDEEGWMDRRQGSKSRFNEEIKRMGFNVEVGGSWRVSKENSDFSLCASYPPEIIVPVGIDKKKLELIANYRSARRFPAVVWRHKGNGAVISRCSQPEVGWFGWRCTEDEDLVQSIVLACAFNDRKEGDVPAGPSSFPSSNSLEVVPSDSVNAKKLMILDARSYMTAFSNRARGGGCECLEYYTACEIQFMNLANIHSIRKSFLNVRQLAALPAEQANWFSQVESCKWLHHMSGLMKAAVSVVTAIEVDCRPVMVHCSDGWDRTPQIVSLAEILLDPYYRSFEGFEVLVEREWLDFGHKFADRCGQGLGSEDPNERCPVFLQWLDCLHQLLREFPSAFEFNGNFLMKLAHHTYSNLFGTFLCNTAKERIESEIGGQTYSVWKFLRSSANHDKFKNHLYVYSDKVLWPTCEVRDLVLWTGVYLGADRPHRPLTEAINPSSDSSPAPSLADGEPAVLADVSRLVKTRSCEDISNHHSTLTRRLSDPRMESSLHEEVKLVEDEVKEPLCADPPLPLTNGVIESSTDTLVAQEIPHLPLRPNSPDGKPTECETCERSRRILKKQVPHPSETLDDSLLRSSEPKVVFDVDGSTFFHDEVQSRLNAIVGTFKSQIEGLELELKRTRMALMKQVAHKCAQQTSDRGDDVVSLGESVGSMEAPSAASQSSEVSWEAVEERDAGPPLWLPDFAVNQCCGCDQGFWLGRRKHHCRSCGKIFCADCSENTIPIPSEQIFTPVRVCFICFQKIKSSLPTLNGEPS